MLKKQYMEILIGIATCTVSLLDMTSACAADAITVSYDVSSRKLRLPSLVIGDTQYNGLVIKLDNITVISPGVDSKVSGPGVPPLCSPFSAAFTQAQIDAVKNGMNLDQVNQALGCQYSSFGLASGTNPDGGFEGSWLAGLNTVIVDFDRNGLVVGK